MRESQSFSFHALRELGLALRSSRRELSDGTLVIFQILREGPFTCSPLVCGRRRPESSPRCNGQFFCPRRLSGAGHKQNETPLCIERELWLGQFEVYSSFGYLGVFIGCRLRSRWSLMGCNGRNGCGNGPVFRGKVRRGVCFRSKFLATENAARDISLILIRFTDRSFSFTKSRDGSHFEKNWGVQRPS